MRVISVVGLEVVFGGGIGAIGHGIGHAVASGTGVGSGIWSVNMRRK